MTRVLTEFKARNGLDVSAHNLAPTVHLTCEHRMDTAGALDQSSQGSHDHGIDGWFLSPDRKSLTLYQSKFTERIQQALTGLADLRRALTWADEVICQERVPKTPPNPCLTNLMLALSTSRNELETVRLVLLSLAPEDQIQAVSEFDDLIAHIQKSKLHRLLLTKNGSVELQSLRHNFTKNTPKLTKPYKVETFADTLLELREGVQLQISYVSLSSLVNLYRERGIILFDKNVRLSLLPFTQNSSRVAHPMEDTLRRICSGELPPEIFPFYHVGITVCADQQSDNTNGMVTLTSPSVLNGCQTISIAHRFHNKLKDDKNSEGLKRFEKICVLAKIVVGASSEELREITNSNNRQNPIEDWQLFSNDPIHIRIADALEEQQVFYERQKGKHHAVKSDLDVRLKFSKSGDHCITPPELGQITSLMQGQINRAARPADIFSSRKSHDAVFGDWIIRDAEQVIVTYNLFKSAQRAFKNVLKNGQQNDSKYGILDKPVARAHFWHLGMLYMLQRYEIVEKHRNRLLKKATPVLVSELEIFFRKYVPRTLTFYWRETDKGAIEIPSKKRDDFHKQLVLDCKLRAEDAPFRETAAKI